MGVVSTSGRWQAPVPSSLLGLLLSKHVYLDTWHPLQVNPRCAITCPRYANAPDANTSLVMQTKGGLPIHCPWGHGHYHLQRGACHTRKMAPMSTSALASVHAICWV